MLMRRFGLISPGIAMIKESEMRRTTVLCPVI
jgi:hypothetical protein